MISPQGSSWGPSRHGRSPMFLERGFETGPSLLVYGEDPIWSHSYRQPFESTRRLRIPTQLGSRFDAQRGCAL